MTDTSTRKQQLTSYALLTIGAFIWGSAFISQKVGMDYLGALAFNGIRNLIGTSVLIPVILILDKKKKPELLKAEKKNKKVLIKSGVICGILLAAASTSQQYALKYTTIGKVSFITTLYMIFVPIIGFFLGKKFRWILWISAILASAGMYILCLKRGEGFALSKGVLLAFLCAVLFAFQILALDKYTPMVNAVKLACIQFFVCGLICCSLMLVFENPTFSDVKNAAVPLLYAGVLSTGVAYTFQAVGQKHANPVMATIIMSLESVFALIVGWIVLKERMTARELTGCLIIFAGVLLTQLPERKKKEIKEI